MRAWAIAVVMMVASAGEASGQKAPPIAASILSVSADGSGSVIVVNVGHSDGVAAGWKVTIHGLRGSFVIARCSRTSCHARTSHSVGASKNASKIVTVRP